MTDDLFLTENRRDVLGGTSEWSAASITTEKSRIRSKAGAALAELIEVAQSTEIENRSVFDPEEVGTLLYWILNDPALFPVEQRGGLIGTADDPPEGVSEEAYTKIPNSLQQYRREIHSEAAQELLRIDHPERGRR
jgi:hypothetical protein